MDKYLIKYNSGYGDETEIIEAPSEISAEMYAYEAWRESVESQADYSAQPLTQELAEDWGYEEELESDD